MHITSRSLQTIAWSTIALSVAHAQNVIENLSFGQTPGYTITHDFSSIPHFSVKGVDDFSPQLLTDRVILTPPYPGSKRGSIWAQNPLTHSGDWMAELDFRATGADRGGGNLQIWYVKESQANQMPTSLYTAPKFDGLVLVIDQYEGRGGSVRGFLNDGSKDIKSQPNPDTLAFGKCDYAYRNRGQVTPLKIRHTGNFLEVIVDGEACLKTDKIKLPEGYYFGISASSAENPDSFEIFKFIVSTQGPQDPKQRNLGSTEHQQQQNIAMQKAHQDQTHRSNQRTDQSIPKSLEDVLADSISSQQDQFADLHNRVQIMNHYIMNMHDRLERMQQENEQRYNELVKRISSIDDRSAASIRLIEKVDRSTNDILRDLQSKDFKDMIQQVHRAIENSQEGLSRSLPLAMGAVVGSHKPSLVSFLFIAIAVQIMVTGAYLVYKKRRNGAPKKYL